MWQRATGELDSVFQPELIRQWTHYGSFFGCVEHFGEGPTLMVQIRADKLSLSSTLGAYSLFDTVCSILIETLMFNIHLMVRSAMLWLILICTSRSPSIWCFPLIHSVYYTERFEQIEQFRQFGQFRSGPMFAKRTNVQITNVEISWRR